MVIYLRSTDGNPDSRLQKYLNYLSASNIVFHVLCWDRFLKFENNTQFTYFHKKAEYGSGMKNAFKLLLFNLFLIKQLYVKRNTYQVIHACDFDTILPAILFKLLFHKKVIYDIFDWFVDSREFHNKLIKSFILSLEKFSLKKADITIICEEERKKQICWEPKELWILPNIPHFDTNLPPNEISINYPIIISYVGVLTRHRGLEKILEVVKNNPDLLYLKIAGFGELENQIKEHAGKYSNIEYYGSVQYEKGLSIMNNSDLILAIYETDIPNHIYAAPNKYYEGLYLGKPILTTKGTFVGEKTEKYKTGFAIGETYNDLYSFFSTISKDTFIIIGNNANKLWETNYCDYVNRFMNNKYIPFIIL